MDGRNDPLDILASKARVDVEADYSPENVQYINIPLIQNDYIHQIDNELYINKIHL